MKASRRNILMAMATAPAVYLAAPKIFTGALAATEDKGVQVPGIYRFWVGEIEITALLDGYNTIPASFVLGYDKEIARQSAQSAYKPFNPGQISLPINGYVIKTGDRRILIDAGAPKSAGEGVGNLSQNLKAAGINADDIDTLLFTHLHVDHVGALTDHAGNKQFKNARLVCSEAEWNFTHDDKVYSSLPEGFRPFFDISRKMVQPYASDRSMFNGEKEIAPGITAIPLPGHTPGHTGFALNSNGESLLIWGDVIHLSGLQFANPDWGLVFDVDPEQAKQTRKMMFDRASTERMAVAGMHIDFPGIGYVERSGTSYRYISAPWQSSQ